MTGAAGPADAAAAAVARDLAALGVRPGGDLLVHASFRSLGPVPGGPETVVRGLLAALGPAGTLLMPALSYELVTPAAPVFDLLRTGSHVGALAESFRTRAGTRRSVHPTHSVCAAGARVAELLDGHALDDTPCGPHSPWRRLRDRGGRILFLGCGLDANTSMHGVEELVEPPYLFGPASDVTVIPADGASAVRRYRPHGFAGVEQRYDRAAALLEPAGALHRGPVLAASCLLVEAAPLWALAAAALQRDAWHFVDRKAPHS